jgi:1,2-phenylacetyl-CoA epoxidase catalytic subunit
MNKNQPNRSLKELYEDNKDKRINYQTQYNKDNKEKYNIYQKQYQKKYRLMKKEKSLNSIDNSITCDNSSTR